MKLADEDTKAATGRKPPAPGKKWVRVIRTKMSTVDGYMQAEDYSSYEEQDDDKRAGAAHAVKAKPAMPKVEKKAPQG